MTWSILLACLAFSGEMDLVISSREDCVACVRLKDDLAAHPEVLSGVVGSVEVIEADEWEPVPALRLYRNGKVVRARVGYVGIEDLREWLHADLL